MRLARKRWYIHESDWYFVSHAVAFDKVDGPYTRADAHKYALWRANQNLRNGTKTLFEVTTESEPKRWMPALAAAASPTAQTQETDHA